MKDRTEHIDSSLLPRQRTPSSARRIGSVTALLAFFYSTCGLALESDKLAAVAWQAEGNSTMTIEGDTRTLTMEDRVIVTQGSLRISGDKAIFEYAVATNELTRITVYGSPVNYRQTLSEEDGSGVIGESTTLQLYSDEQTNESIVELTGDASIESPDSSMNCANIVYLVDLDLIREAAGPCTGSLSNQTEN